MNYNIQFSVRQFNFSLYKLLFIFGVRSLAHSVSFLKNRHHSNKIRGEMLADVNKLIGKGQFVLL